VGAVGGALRAANLLRPVWFQKLNTTAFVRFLKFLPGLVSKVEHNGIRQIFEILRPIWHGKRI
jgi:hypothetical protein